VEKELLIQEKDKLYVELKSILARQPGPEVGSRCTTLFEFVVWRQWLLLLMLSFLAFRLWSLALSPLPPLLLCCFCCYWPPRVLWVLCFSSCFLLRACGRDLGLV
jgi:hypothetical protein